MKTAILVSGRGSNMAALLEAHRQGRLAAEPVVVFSNKPDALALTKAKAAGVATEVLAHKDFASREAFDAAVVTCLRRYAIELVVLAGYMRIVTPIFLAAFANRVINIHPSLLPAFPGTNSVKQAWDYGVKVVGCTAHFVDAAIDHGPIIAQQALVVREGETAEELAARLLPLEHETLLTAINLVAKGQVIVEGRRVIVRHGN